MPAQNQDIACAGCTVSIPALCLLDCFCNLFLQISDPEESREQLSLIRLQVGSAGCHLRFSDIRLRKDLAHGLLRRPLDSLFL